MVLCPRRTSKAASQAWGKTTRDVPPAHNGVKPFPARPRQIIVQNLPRAAMHYLPMYGIISSLAWDNESQRRQSNVLPAIFGSSVLPAAGVFSAVVRRSRRSSLYLGTMAILVFYA